MEKQKDRQFFANLLTPVIVIALAMLVIVFVLVFAGNNPLTVFAVLIKGAFGSRASMINVLTKAVPIGLSSLAVGMAKKSGIFNIGVEGQLIFGALGCTVAGIYLTGLPAVVHIPVCLLSGMAAGALYAVLPSVMYLKNGANLLVVFILMNNIVKKLNTFFVVAVIGDPSAFTTSSLPLKESAFLPNLITKPGKLNIGVLIFAVLCIIFYYVYYKTTAGFNIAAIGLNRGAAAYSGLDVRQYIFVSLVVGGAIAGLAGSIEVMGTYHRLYDGFSPGYGFDGIPIALLSGGNPFGMIVGSILFAALRVGSLSLQLETGISGDIVSVIQGVLIVLIACESIIRHLAGRVVNGRGRRNA